MTKYKIVISSSRIKLPVGATFAVRSYSAINKICKSCSEISVYTLGRPPELIGNSEKTFPLNYHSYIFYPPSIFQKMVELIFFVRDEGVNLMIHIV